MSKTVKVLISLVVEVDQEQWSNEYGVDNTATAVRADVRHWATQLAGTELPVDGRVTVR